MNYGELPPDRGGPLTLKLRDRSPREPTPRTVAYHESGHAVMVCLLEWKINYVTIVPHYSTDHQGWVRGLCHADIPGNAPPFATALLMASGAVGAARDAHPDARPFDHSYVNEYLYGQDRKSFDEAIKPLACSRGEVPNHTERWAIGHTIDLLCHDRKAWGCVRQIADALREHETLLGVQVQGFFDLSYKFGDIPTCLQRY